MKLWKLALRNVFRSPTRALLTLVAMALGTVAFLFLEAVVDLWYSGVEASRADRLLVRNKTALTQPLPLHYAARLESVPGVNAVSFGGWFGGRMGQTQRDFFPSAFVDPGTFLRVYDELLLPPEQAAAWVADPCGAIAGDALAARFGWRPGEVLTLQGTLFPGEWQLTLRGVYSGARAETDTGTLLLAYRCINERLPEGLRNQVGWFALRIRDPSSSPRVGREVDALFANSSAETTTESERAFHLTFAAMAGSLLRAVRLISWVVLGIDALVLTNTMALSIRDRRRELATLRALGFSRRPLLALLGGEAVALALLAAALGAFAAPPAIGAFRELASRSMGALPSLPLGARNLALGFGSSLLVGLVSSLVPALLALRAPITTALREGR